MNKVGIGIIGCGNISGAYLKAMAGFPILDIRALADLKPEAARAAAAPLGLRACSVDELLRDDSIEIVVNLTIPAAHVAVGLQAIAAGKHVHSEKPLGLSVADARRLIDAAARRSLRVGCAPDTFLGGGHQACRQLVDAGAIGRAVAGTGLLHVPGSRALAPAPAFITQPAAGPCSTWARTTSPRGQPDRPVTRVAGITDARARSARSAASRNAQVKPSCRRGGNACRRHTPGVPECGAVISMATSFDVPSIASRQSSSTAPRPALVMVPDPNRFGGPGGTRPHR
jgi:hypothetical protein